MAGLNVYPSVLDLAALRSLCESHGEFREYRRGESFLAAGERSSHIGLILDGWFKYTVRSTSGEDCVTGFAFGGEYVADFHKAVNGGVSPTTIVAGRAATALVIPADRLTVLSCEEHESFASQAIMVLYGILYERYLALYRYSPEERYRMLLRNHPDVLQTVPLRDIASFLQVTPVHLSRLRRKLLDQP